MRIEQAIYSNAGSGGYHFVARSPGFEEGWLPEAERLCTGFGERPAGVSCSLAVFARPFAVKHVAVVQVADQGLDDTGRPGALAFRLLIVPVKLYQDLGGDPFHLADLLPPTWNARGELTSLDGPFDPPPQRTVAMLQKIIDVPHSPTLLGGVQALLDGGRLVFERNEPSPDLVRSLWALLPTASRFDLWPTSYAFGNGHQFHVVVVPRANGPEYENYVTEVQAGDYPEGRYELAIQSAIESGDQGEIDSLLARRSRSQMMRLGLILLAAFIVVPLLVFYSPKQDPPDKEPEKKQPKKTKKPAKEKLTAPLELAPLDDYPPLLPEERDELALRLQKLGRQLGTTLPVGATEEMLAKTIAAADVAIDKRLGDKKSTRDPGTLHKHGPVMRQLHALLWKHEVAHYGDLRRKPAEVVDALAEKLGLKEPAND